MRVNPKYLAILEMVAKIPKGNVSTYGEIASLSGFPRCARLVGTALRSDVSGPRIPWYRVVNSQGKLSFPIGSPKYKIQKQRLVEEGVVFHKGSIDLNQYGWGRDLDKALWS
jgi:methylated-DNA-protein-cysteine methyltransferase-like protein